jgi:hypothetical protein
MRIRIKQKGFIALGMAFGRKKFEEDCTEQGANILEHAIKCYAVPHAREVNKWQKEISAFLSKFKYKVRFKAKRDDIHSWLWSVDVPQWYEAICTDKLKEATLPYGEAHGKLHAFMGEVTNFIEANVNSNAPKQITLAKVKQMMKLYPAED